MSIDIIGIGYAPGGETRANSWWQSELVATWANADKVTAKAVEAGMLKAAEPDRTTLEFFRGDLEDPFRGVESRPVLGPDQTVDELNTLAAQRALERAGVAAQSIDLLVTHDLCPQLLGTNVAPTLHTRLGLRSDCLAYSMDASANSFIVQLEIAKSAIASGRAKYVLLTQSNVASRLMDYGKQFSGWFGDLATAVVVSKAAPSTGLLSLTHRVDGSLQGHLVIGIPGKNWWEDGRSILYDAPHLRDRVFIGLGRFFINVGRYALDDARVDGRDIDVLASHQGFRWISELCKKVLGLPHARTAVTHAWTANVTACNLPVQLATAVDAGTLSSGNKVLLVAGGNGITYSGAVLTWR